MGRLNKALERIKSREAENVASASRKMPAEPSSLVSAKSFDDPITANTQRVKLDTDLLSRNHIITDEIDPGVRTAYKMLRTRVLQRMRANGWRSLAVTSASQGDGKSLTAINLAISMAGDVNHNVCLVDLDLRHSSIGSYLGLKPGPGVSDCLANQVPPEKIFVRPDIERLVVAPNFKQVTHSSEMLSSPAMHELNAMLVSDPSRIVIYDMPPLLSADDMLAFEPATDAILLVIAEGKTARTDSIKAFELLENLDVVGTVLNRSDEKTASYY